MKSTMTLLAAICFAAFASQATAAPSKGEALTDCKSHIAELYAGEQRTKLKKIKKRGGGLEVKFKVTAEGEKFNAVCSFAKNGEMTYSTDRAAIAGS